MFKHKIMTFAAILISFSSEIYAKTAYPGGTWEPGPAKYGVEIVQDIRLKMDDGVVLNASIAYPTDLTTGKQAEGKFPVVIEHTPYAKFSATLQPNSYFSEHGYISVLITARGGGKSTGQVDNSGLRDAKDGQEVIDWAAHKLNKSDGRVAMIGCSWPGMIALSTAGHVREKSPLKAIIAACSGFESIHREAWMVGGLPTTALWQVTQNAQFALGDTPAAQQYFKMIKDGIQQSAEQAYERRYWRERVSMNLAKPIVENDIAVLLWSGWRDFVPASALRSYTALQNAYIRRPVYAAMQANQKISPKYQIIMGDWGHSEGLDVGIYLQWLETWVRGIDTGIQDTETPMHLFEKGSNQWVNIKSYPVTTQYESFFLQPNERLEQSQSVKTENEKINWGEPEQNGTKRVFNTQIFPEGATLAGPMSVTLYASSNNSNLVLIAKLFDVNPQGQAELLTSGAILGSLSQLDQDKSWKDKHGNFIWPWHKFDREQYLKPNKVYRFDVALSPRQWAIKANHRLRLELTTAQSESICPNEGIPTTTHFELCGQTLSQLKTVPGGVYHLFYGTEYPSALNLPLLPLDPFKKIHAGQIPTAWNENLRKIVKQEPLIPTYALPLDWGK